MWLQGLGSACTRPVRLKLLRLGVGGLLLVPLICAIFYHDNDSEVREAAGAFTIVLTNYVGDVACSLTGALAAGMEGMDLLGCVVVGFVTALGGGTFRDLLLGRPIAWLVDWDEALLCVSVRQRPHMHSHSASTSETFSDHTQTPHTRCTPGDRFTLAVFLGGNGDLLSVAAALPPLQVELFRRMDVLARCYGPRRLRRCRCVQGQPRRRAAAALGGVRVLRNVLRNLRRVSSRLALVRLITLCGISPMPVVMVYSICMQACARRAPQPPAADSLLLLRNVRGAHHFRHGSLCAKA